MQASTPPADPSASMTGLEVMLALRDGKLSRPRMLALFDARLTEVVEGRAVFTGTPGPQHYNPMGGVHGGYAATLLDSCMGCAVHSTLPAGQGFTTMELKVSYVRGMTAATGPVRAEGTILNAGRRVAFAEGRLLDNAGRLMAHATSTCLIFPLPA